MKRFKIPIITLALLMCVALGGLISLKGETASADDSPTPMTLLGMTGAAYQGSPNNRWVINYKTDVEIPGDNYTKLGNLNVKITYEDSTVQEKSCAVHKWGTDGYTIGILLTTSGTNLDSTSKARVEIEPGQTMPIGGVTHQLANKVDFVIGRGNAGETIEMVSGVWTNYNGDNKNIFFSVTLNKPLPYTASVNFTSSFTTKGIERNASQSTFSNATKLSFIINRNSIENNEESQIIRLNGYHGFTTDGYKYMYEKGLEVMYLPSVSGVARLYPVSQELELESLSSNVVIDSFNRYRFWFYSDKQLLGTVDDLVNGYTYAYNFYADGQTMPTYIGAFGYTPNKIVFIVDRAKFPSDGRTTFVIEDGAYMASPDYKYAVKISKGTKLIRESNNWMEGETVSVSIDGGDYEEKLYPLGNVDFAKPGYTATVKVDGVPIEGTVYTVTRGVNAQIEVEYTGIPYNITYKLYNGYNTATNPRSYTLSSGTIALEEPTKPGFEFGGWYLDAAFSGSPLSALTVDDSMIGGIELHAKWLPKDDMGSLSVTLSSGQLTINAGTSDDNEYQYWIKTKVHTDGIEEKSYRYIWQLISNFEKGLKSYTYTVNSFHLDEEGNYSIVVRIKNADGVLINELHGSYSPEDLGVVMINYVEVDGYSGEKIYIIEDEALIKVEAVNAVSYQLVTDSGTFDFDTEEFTIDCRTLKAGIYNVKVRAIGTSGYDEYSLKLYVVGDYDASQVPVILSLDGSSDEDGKTEFTMTLKKADNSSFPYSAIQNDDYKVTFSSNGVTYLPTGGVSKTINYNGAEINVLELKFDVDYKNKYGIYYTFASVSRDGISEDDKIIVNYSGYSRGGTLTQTGSAYEAAKNTTITITASGTINDSSNALKYAFYREDASGWVLIKDYPKDGSSGDTLTWTPARAGTYRIQVRVREEGQGSYEVFTSRAYVITGDGLEENSLSLNIYDRTTNTIVTGSLKAGTAYILRAEYTGSNDVLYMFTLTNANLGTIYLNKFTTDNSFIFVPNKDDTYTITARVINVKNFGCYDIYESVTVTSELP